MTRPRIGIVDDDAGMRTALSALLADNNFEPLPMESIADCLEVRKSTSLDLVLIDLQLRGESGLELAMAIRRTSDTPIVMLTGRGDETDKIVGLEVGADDYLLKPFNPRELVARIRAVLRRYGTQTAITAEPVTRRDRVPFGHLVLDRTKRILLTRSDTEIPLTNAEYRLLEFFLGRPGEVVPRVDLLAELGGDLNRYVDRTIDVLILRLRRKIELNPSKPVHLQTRRGQGYVFVIGD